MLPVLIVAILALGGAVAVQLSPMAGHGKHRATLRERRRRVE